MEGISHNPSFHRKISLMRVLFRRLLMATGISRNSSHIPVPGMQKSPAQRKPVVPPEDDYQLHEFEIS
jgi:hypothetical protein